MYKSGALGDGKLSPRVMLGPRDVVLGDHAVNEDADLMKTKRGKKDFSSVLHGNNNIKGG